MRILYSFVTFHRLGRPDLVLRGYDKFQDFIKIYQKEEHGIGRLRICHDAHSDIDKAESQNPKFGETNATCDDMNSTGCNLNINDDRTPNDNISPGNKQKNNSTDEGVQLVMAAEKKGACYSSLGLQLLFLILLIITIHICLFSEEINVPPRKRRSNTSRKVPVVEIVSDEATFRRSSTLGSKKKKWTDEETSALVRMV